jgi:transcriptional regulator with XRE-family HTH domain
MNIIHKPMKYGAYVKSLREAGGFSQGFMSQKLNLSRPTYIQIEKDEREITISEANLLADIFGMTLDDFLQKQPPIFVDIETKKKSEKSKTDLRISVPQKNLEKFKEVLIYILGKVGAKPNIGETALCKLLYFIDFDFYEKHEEQLIGATYIRNHYGPTPAEFTKIVQGMINNSELEQVKSQHFQYEQKKYLPRREADLSKLNALELSHIDEVLNRLSDKSAKELSEYSHTDVPWQVHKPGEIISYESVFYRDPEHSVKNYEDEL